MDVSRVVISADHHVNREEHGRGAIERDAFKQQRRRIYEQNDAGTLRDSKLDVGLARYVEFFNYTETALGE